MNKRYEEKIYKHRATAALSSIKYALLNDLAGQPLPILNKINDLVDREIDELLSSTPSQ